MFQLQQFLDAQAVQNLTRTRRVAESAQAPRGRYDGKDYLSFCSNDYLGLANDPRIAKAMQKGIDHYGVGSGASHLINGHSAAHHALEEELADFVGYERALLFSTGYMANLGVVSGLLNRHDTVFADKLVHASLIDATHLSRASLKRYAHNNVSALSSLLSSIRTTQKLVVTDGVFSMDGDIAPVSELLTQAKQHDAWLLVDDAHGLGVIGEHGRGTLEVCGVDHQAQILVGTLGKAFGTFGAFVAGSHELIETLIQRSRSYMYTTALPPSVAEASREGLRIVRGATDRREKLASLIKRFRDGAEQLNLSLAESITPIQPLIVGSAKRAVEMSEALANKGLLISAVRPPTVPEGSARLRISFSASHSDADVDTLLTALETV